MKTLELIFSTTGTVAMYILIAVFYIVITPFLFPFMISSAVYRNAKNNMAHNYLGCVSGKDEERLFSIMGGGVILNAIWLVSVIIWLYSRYAPIV